MDDEAFSPSGFDSISKEQSAPPAIEPNTYSDSSTHQVLNGDAYSNSNDNPSYNHSDSYNNYVTQDFSTPTHSLTPEYVDHNNSYISGNDGSNTSGMYGDGSIPSYNMSTPDINAESNVPSFDSHESSGIGGETSDVHETPIHYINFEGGAVITPSDTWTLPEPNHGGLEGAGVNSDSSTHQVLNGEAYNNSNDNPSYNHSDSYNNGTQNSSTPDHSLTPETSDHVDVHNNSHNSYISSNNASNTSSMYGDGSISNHNTSTPDTNAGSNIPSIDSHQSSGSGSETSNPHEPSRQNITFKVGAEITPSGTRTLPEPKAEHGGLNNLGNGIAPSNSGEYTNVREVPIHKPQLDNEHVDVKSNIPFINSHDPSGIEPQLSSHQKPYIDTKPELSSIGTPTDQSNTPDSSLATNVNEMNLENLLAEIRKKSFFGAVAGGSMDFLGSMLHNNNLMKALQSGKSGAISNARYELGYTGIEQTLNQFFGRIDENSPSKYTQELLRSAVQGCAGGAASSFSILGCGAGAAYETILTIGQYRTGSLGVAGFVAGVLTHKLDTVLTHKLDTVLTHKLDTIPLPYLSHGISAALYESIRDSLFPDDKPINKNGDK